MEVERLAAVVEYQHAEQLDRVERRRRLVEELRWDLCLLGVHKNGIQAVARLFDFLGEVDERCMITVDHEPLRQVNKLHPAYD
eukprot:591832-Pleurochrysis_carterae.AAC.2